MPFIAYFMTLLWAALLGDTFDIEKNNMFTEWLLCMQIYIIIVIFYSLRKKVTND